MSTTERAAAAGQPDDAPCCWLCLEEGPNESGEDLVRDCSCRGTSGFAHLSCMITNAHHLGEQAAKENGSYFALSKCFQVCTNCKQQYQNNLYYDMMKALVVFVDKEFEGIENADLHVCSLRDIIRVVDVEKEQDRAEGEAMISKLLSILEEMKQSSDHQDMEGRDAKMEAMLQ